MATSYSPQTSTSNVISTEAAGRPPKEPAASHAPRAVTRGVKLRSTSIDWLSMSFSVDKKEQVIAYLASLFGKATRMGYGLNSYRDMYEWQPGVYFAWNGKGDSSETCWMQVSGEACVLLGSVMFSFLERMHSIGPKKITRLDVAIDFEGEQLGILDAARAAAIEKQVAGVHTKARKGSKTRPLQYIEDGEGGRTQYFGSRSTAKTRVYDKGVQTGQCEPKQWERWETQFADDRATILFLLLVEAGPDAFLKIARAHAIGAVEFREVAKSNRSMSRRPFLAWYQGLCQWLGKQRIRLPKRELPTLDKYLYWIRKQVLPMAMGVSAAAGISLGEFFSRLSGDVVPNQSTRAEYLGQCFSGSPPGIHA